MSENYLELEQHLKSKGLSKSPLRVVQLEQIRELDKKCELCMAQPGRMLCNGYRLFFDKEDSEASGTVRIGPAACSKAQDKEEKEARRKRYKSIYIGQSDLERLFSNPTERMEATVAKTVDGFVVNGELVPLTTQARSTASSSAALMEYAVAMAYSGYQPKYVVPAGLFSSTKPISSWYNDFVTDADWLIVDPLDLAPGFELMRATLYQVIAQRVALRKMTTITLGTSGDLHKLSSEQVEFLKEVRTWNEFPLR